MHTPRIESVSIALLLLTANVGAQQANSWSTFQANNKHDGASPIVIQPSSLTFAWETFVGNGAVYPAAIADGIVVVTHEETGWGGGIYGLSAATGTQLWDHFSLPGDRVGQPGVHSGQVFVVFEDSPLHTMRAYDLQLGTVNFYAGFETQNFDFFAPSSVDGKVYFNAGRTGGLSALDAATGVIDWFLDMELGDMWSPSIDGDFCYGYASGFLVAADRHTGAQVYSVQDFGAYTAGVVGHTPVVGGMDDLFVINGGRLVRFRQSDGQVLWSIYDDFTGHPSIRNGMVYSVNQGALEVRDQVDGSLLSSWTPPTGNLGENLILTPGHVIAATETDTYLLDRNSLAQSWTYPAGGWLTLGEGYLLIARPDGYLTAITYNELPQVISATPDKLNYYESNGQTVTLHGFGFDEPGATSVLFGPVGATQVTVVDANTLLCDLPDGEPGYFDVSVTDTSGSTALTNAFTFTPAQSVSGDFVLGGQVHLSLRFEEDLGIIGLYDIGQARTSPRSVPPLEGGFWLKKFSILFEVPQWPFGDDLILDFLIPNDPSLLGQSIQLQSVVGPDPRGYHGAFTNLATITIQ